MRGAAKIYARLQKILQIISTCRAKELVPFAVDVILSFHWWRGLLFSLDLVHIYLRQLASMNALASVNLYSPSPYVLSPAFRFSWICTNFCERIVSRWCYSRILAPASRLILLSLNSSRLWPTNMQSKWRLYALTWRVPNPGLKNSFRKVLTSIGIIFQPFNKFTILAWGF